MTDPSIRTTPPGPQEGSTTQVVADQAKGVAQDLQSSAGEVASTAKDETLQVAAEAKQQAKDLFDQVRGELTSQTSSQQHRAASGLHALADELSGMAEGPDQSGVASDLARQAATRTHSVADWLDAREPGDVVAEVKTYARRKPGTFLAAAALFGFIGGRLTRGLTEAGAASPEHPGPRNHPDLTDSSAAAGPARVTGNVPGLPRTAAPTVLGMSHGQPVEYTDGSGAGTGARLPDTSSTPGGVDPKSADVGGWLPTESETGSDTGGRVTEEDRP